jgi:hypothetical protein
MQNEPETKYGRKKDKAEGEEERKLQKTMEDD